MFFFFFQSDFESDLGLVFRLLVLTVPSMYSVAYLALWQTHLTRLDSIFGAIMLLVQGCQMLSCALLIVPKFLRPSRAQGR